MTINPLVTALAISLCMISTSFAGVADKISRASNSQINMIAKSMAEDLSKDMPVKINKYTTNSSVIFISSTKTIIYGYEVTTHVSSSEMRPRVIATICSNEILRALSSRGITFRYYYTNTAGYHLLTEDVKFKDCH